MEISSLSRNRSQNFEQVEEHLSGQLVEMRLNVEAQDLRLTIPEGTAIQDGKSLGNAAVLETDTVVTPDTLDKIKSKTKSSMIKFMLAADIGASTTVK